MYVRVFQVHRLRVVFRCVVLNIHLRGKNSIHKHIIYKICAKIKQTLFQYTYRLALRCKETPFLDFMTLLFFYAYANAHVHTYINYFQICASVSVSFSLYCFFFLLVSIKHVNYANKINIIVLLRSSY